MKTALFSCSLLCLGLVMVVGCSRQEGVSQSEFCDYDNQVTTTELTLQIRIFDALVHGDTNAASHILAREIDSNIAHLYFAAKEQHLNLRTNFLYMRAIEYRRRSNELQALSDFEPAGGIPINAMLQEAQLDTPK
jgi:hypothetical protein